MHFPTTILLPLTLFFTAATSTPAASNLQRRGLPGAVYICTDQNFRGNCAWQAPSTNCRIVGTGNFAPESIGPDPGGYCNLYSSAGCTGLVRTLRFPGLGSGLPRFSSLRCYKNTAVMATGGRRVEGAKAAGEGEVVSPKLLPAKLAGGVGSTQRKEVEDQLKEMEKDGFKRGFIGQKKGLYY